MIKIYRYSVWKGNRAVKMSDDKSNLIKYIDSCPAVERENLWLARNDGFGGWVGEPIKIKNGGENDGKHN